jgi:hypothetical protein
MKQGVFLDSVMNVLTVLQYWLNLQLLADPVFQHFNLYSKQFLQTAAPINTYA